VVKPPPLLALVGPTGVGKTAIAVRLASALPLEAVNADSRQVYRGMDIGTGKPTAEERARLPHHLIDVVDPDERYHVARWRAQALEALAAIRRRGRLPVLVGGTGLYVRSLLKGLRPAPPADPLLRRELEGYAQAEGAAALHARLATVDPEAARRLHPNDRVRIIRAIEVCMRSGNSRSKADEATDWSRAVPEWHLLVVGLRQEAAVLRVRIAERARGMLARGLIEEVRGLLAKGHDASLPSMGGIGYREFAGVLAGRLAEEEALRLMIRDTIRYAKRQMTWFARDPEIRWIDLDRAGGAEAAADEILEQVTREGMIE
jgi:tRNA dimethylallyltransferase